MPSAGRYWLSTAFGIPCWSPPADPRRSGTDLAPRVHGPTCLTTASRTPAGRCCLRPSFEPARAGGDRHILECAFGLPGFRDCWRLAPLSESCKVVRNRRGVKWKREVEPAVAATLTSQKPRSFGFPAGQRPAPVLAGQDRRVFARASQLDGRGRESARGRDVFEPGQVVLVHLGDDVRVAGPRYS